MIHTRLAAINQCLYEFIARSASGAAGDIIEVCILAAALPGACLALLLPLGVSTRAVNWCKRNFVWWGYMRMEISLAFFLRHIWRIWGSASGGDGNGKKKLKSSNYDSSVSWWVSPTVRKPHWLARHGLSLFLYCGWHTHLLGFNAKGSHNVWGFVWLAPVPTAAPGGTGLWRPLLPLWTVCVYTYMTPTPWCVCTYTYGVHVYEHDPHVQCLYIHGLPLTYVVRIYVHDLIHGVLVHAVNGPYICCGYVYTWPCMVCVHVLPLGKTCMHVIFFMSHS